MSGVIQHDGHSFAVELEKQKSKTNDLSQNLYQGTGAEEKS
jgi:hypothetical protein